MCPAVVGGYLAGFATSTHVGSASITVSGCGSKKNGIAYRSAAVDAATRWTVCGSRPLVQRVNVFPELTTNDSGRSLTAAQSRPCGLIHKPGTSLLGSSAMN